MNETLDSSARRDDLRMISDLIDGELAGSERTEALRRIEGDPALYEVFAETARYRESRRVDRFLTFRRWPVAVGGLLAACLALVVVVPRLLPGDPLSSSSLASALTTDGQLGRTLSSPGWFEPAWPGMRGVGSPDSRSSFRAGAQALDLGVALSAGKREDARSLAGRLALELQELPFLARGYEDLRDRLGDLPATGSLAAIEEMHSDLEAALAEGEGLDLLAFEFGRWCEAGRLAGESGNAEILERRTFRAFLSRLDEREWPPQVEKELSRLRDLLQPELNELQVAALGVSFRKILSGF